MGLFVGGFIPSLIFGVAFGNLLQGVPFHFNELNQVTYEGSTLWKLLGLLNPFALVCGIVSLMMLTTQGATWLQMKTTGELRNRVRAISQVTALVTAIVFVIAGVWAYFLIDGFVLTSTIDHNAASVFTTKQVALEKAGLFKNYVEMPILWVIPALALGSALLTVVASKANNGGLAFLCSSLMQAGVILTAGVAMFPFVMPSITHPEMSLTMWDSTASHNTLNIMFIVACIFVPIVLAYTLWSYIKMYGRLDAKYIENNNASLY